jgi:hypothetical protein
MVRMHYFNCIITEKFIELAGYYSLTNNKYFTILSNFAITFSNIYINFKLYHIYININLLTLFYNKVPSWYLFKSL